MKKTWKSKTIVYKYADKTIVHTVTKPEQQLFYFSGSDEPFRWDGGGCIEIKPKFITRFKNRVRFFGNKIYYKIKYGWDIMPNRGEE